MSDFKTLNGYYVKDETARNGVAANASDISALRAGVINYDLKNIYVDCYAGDDSNDGTSSAKAFKTLDRALDEVNAGNINIAVKLMHAGTYYASHPRYTGFTWHMSAHASGCVVDFPVGNKVDGTGKIVFYSMHVNWSVADEFDEQDYYGFTVTTSGAAQGLYQDCGYCLFRRINFTNRWTCHGGQLTMIEAHISSVQGDRAIIDLRDLDINSSDAMTSVIDLDHGSTCTMTGTWYIRDVLSGKTRFLLIRQSKLYVAIGASGGWNSEAVTLPTYAIYQYQMDITSTSGMKTALQAMGDTAYGGPSSGAATINVWNTTANATP